MDMQSLKENQRVQVHSTEGNIRYLGKTSFAQGDWVGVELDTPTGKNDGSVQGVRYFTYQNPNFQENGLYGVFVRPSAIRIVPTFPRQQQPQRQSSGLSQRGHTFPDEAKGSSESTSMPPPKLPTTPSVKKELSRRPSSRLSRASSNDVTLRNGSTTEQELLSSDNQKTSRKPSMDSLNLSTDNTNESLSGPKIAKSRDGSTHKSDKVYEEATQKASMINSSFPLTPINNTVTSSRHSSFSESSVSSEINGQGENDSTIDWKRKAEKLKAKLLLMDQKRMADRDKISMLDQLSQEKYRLEQLVRSLQLKYDHLKGEVLVARQELRSAVDGLEGKETTIQDQVDLIESLTLDKEFADETNETLKSEIVSLKQQLEELTLLKELQDEMSENRMINDDDDDNDNESLKQKADTQDIFHWQKKSEKLEAALINLRNLSMEEDSKAKIHIKELANQVQQFKKEQQETVSLSKQLQEAKDTIEDLRQRLDAAVGAEQMVEKLIEEKLMLGERVQDLQRNVEELEVLKDLNDELENSHIMTEKQLSEQIDFQDSQLRDVERNLHSLTETNSDYEQAIVRYKELLSSLQSDLESLKVSNQVSAAEKEALNARSKEIADANIKLQAFANKSQAKAIDTALQQLTAEESLEKLEIVKDFLPSEIFDHSAFTCAFCIKRVEFKSRLAFELIMESYETILPGDLISLLPSIHNALQSLYISCDNYTFYLNTCSESDFDRCSEFADVFKRVEVRLDGTLSLLKSSNLNPLAMVQELEQVVQVASGIALEETKDDPLYPTFESRLAIDGSLQSFLASLILLEVLYKQRLTEEYPIESHATWSQEVEQVMRASRISSSNLENLNTHISKLLKKSRVRFTEDIVKTCHAIKHIACRVESFALACVDTYFSMAAGFKSFHLDSERCIAVIKEAISQAFGEQHADDLHIPANIVKECTQLISNLNSALTNDQLIDTNSMEKPDGKAWHKKISSIKNAKAVSEDSEALAAGLQEQLKEVLTQLRVKDKQLDEVNLKCEMLESRILKSKDLTLEVETLKEDYEQAQKNEQTLNTEISGLKKELRSKIHQLDQLSGEVQQTEKRKQVLTKNALYLDKSVVTKIDSLNKTIAHLHAELGRQKRKNESSSSTEDASMSWLVIQPTRHNNNSLVNKQYVETMDLTRRFRNLVASTRLNPMELSKNWMPQAAKNSTILAGWIHEYSKLRERMSYLATEPNKNI